MGQDEAGAKVCPKCSLKNSGQKNFCDHCGTPLSGAGPQAPEPPLTAIRDKREPAPGGFNLPMAGRIEPQAEASPSAAQRTQQRRKTTSSEAVPRKSMPVPWGILLALAAVGGGTWKVQDYLKPESTSARAAQEYLEDLGRSQYKDAYALLSPQSKASCTLEEFTAFHTPPPQGPAEAKLARLEGDFALLASPQGALFLIQGEGRFSWNVVFDANLLAKAAQAVDRHDPDVAVLSAQAAVQVNPRDPEARGMLCEAYWSHRMPQDAQRECALAVELSSKYGLSPAKLATWRRFVQGG